MIFPKALGASGAEGPRGFVTAKRRGPSNEIAPKSPTSFTVDRRPLKAPPDPFEIGRIGSTWSILSLDSTRKRGLGRCLACGIVREITVVDGIPACGCSGSRSSARRSAFDETVCVPGLRNRARA